MRFPQLTSVEEFVAWEEQQDEKYEFAGGVVSLFPGATARHEIIILNLAIAIRSILAAGHVRTSGLKQLTRTSSRYPDVSVTFDPRDTVEQTYARYPSLLIEVLSPSTHRTDRGPKSQEYRSIETLREYVLVDSRKRWAQTVRRSGEKWAVSLPILSGSLCFEGIGLDVAFDDLYAGTEL
jgi:Uma2 family endonuclease